MNLIRIQQSIVESEGVRLYPYKDIYGNATIGVGHLITKYENYDKGITLETAGQLLTQDICTAVDDVTAIFGKNIVEQIPEEKLEVLVSIAFNLGRKRMLTFKKMIAAIKTGNWTKAAEELRDSKYYRTLTRRVEKYAKILAE